jgi:hypothetical protein
MVRKLSKIEESTGRTPEALTTAPVMYGYERELVLAFNYLTGRRQVGFAANPIQLTEIEAYIRLVGDSGIPRDIFLELLSGMDEVYMQKVNSGNKSSS